MHFPTADPWGIHPNLPAVRNNRRKAVGRHGDKQSLISQYFLNQCECFASTIALGYNPIDNKRPGSMFDIRSQKLADFVAWTAAHIKGDEKGDAQIFLDRLFQAFGQKVRRKPAAPTKTA